MPTTHRLVHLASVVDQALAQEPRLVTRNTVVVNSDPSVSLKLLAQQTRVTGDVLSFRQNLVSQIDCLAFVGPVRVRIIPRDMTPHKFMNQRSVQPYRMAGSRMTLDFIRLHIDLVRGRRIVCLNSGVLPKSRSHPGQVFFEPQGEGFHSRMSFDREILRKGDVVIIVSY